MKFAKTLLVLAWVDILAACVSGTSEVIETKDDTVKEIGVHREEPYVLKDVPQDSIALSSEAISANGRLDRNYTCEGAHEVTPPLVWRDAPERTKSFVLVLEDAETDESAEGGLWTHWLLYSIPAGVSSISSTPVTSSMLENGIQVGTNDYGSANYLGPCPRPSLIVTPHGVDWQRKTPYMASLRPYYFRLYALDKDFDFGSGATRNEVLKGIDGHIIASGELAAEFRSTKKYHADSVNDLTPPSISDKGHIWLSPRSQ